VSATDPGEVLSVLEDRSRQAKVEQWEIYLSRVKTLSIQVKEGEIDRVHRGEVLSAGLRFIDRERLGYAHASLFEPEALDRLVSSALSGTRLSDPDPHLGLPDPPAQPYPTVDIYDPALETLPLETKVNRVRALEAAALGLDPRVEKVRQAEHRETMTEVWLVSSRGLRHHHRGTVVLASIMVKAAEGSEAEMGFEFDSARYFDKLRHEEVGRRAARRAVDSLGGRKVPTGRPLVILENGVAAEFLEVLSTSFYADHVQKGKSMLAGRVGQRAMAETVTLVDDGLYSQGLGTASADAEGVPQQKTVLVEKGVVQGFLYDHLRARVEGRMSTGNAGRAGVQAPPEVSGTNFYLIPGQKDLQNLILQVREGLLITEVMGVHTANPITGDFSVGAAGFQLKGGERVHPVKGVALAGNLLELLGRVAQVGSDLRWFGSTGAPSLLVEGLSVGGL
jgi:PmbA protein